MRPTEHELRVPLPGTIRDWLSGAQQVGRRFGAVVQAHLVPSLLVAPLENGPKTPSIFEVSDLFASNHAPTELNRTEYRMLLFAEFPSELRCVGGPPVHVD